MVLDVTGTDELANIKQLELQQRAGQFALNGTVRFKPEVGVGPERARRGISIPASCSRNGRGA